MLSVQRITEYGAFLAMAGEWNDAVDRAGFTHPFLRHEWTRSWWDAFGGRNALDILVVRDRDRVCAIAPLMLERSQMYGVPIRRVRMMQNEHTPRADFIVCDREDESVDAIWETLVADRWDVLQLNQLAGESSTRDRLRLLAAVKGYATGIWTSGAAPYVELAGGWDAYWRGRSSKFRQNVRNRLSRLTKLGEPVLEVIEDADAILAAHGDAMRLEDSGWKQSEGTAIEADAQVRRFYSSMFERAADCPWFRLIFLRVGSRRIAVSISAVYNGRLFLIKTGYDPEFAVCSPFKLLTYFAMQYACDRQLLELDFLGDPEPWKQEWTSRARPHDWLFVFSHTPRARVLHPLKFQVLPAIKRWQHPATRTAPCTSQPSRA